MMSSIKALIAMASMAFLMACAGGEAIDEQVGEMPSSLTGTTVDGRLDVDADGRFVITAEAVQLFDYFLTTEGEIDDAGRRLLVAAEARKVGAAAFDAMAFYDRYVEYRRRFDAAVEKAGPAADADALLAHVRRVRAETVGDHPLFADDDALVEHAIATKRAMDAGDTAEAARRMQFAALMTPMSEDDALAARATRAPLRLRHDVGYARSMGADETEIHTLRTAAVGADAANRLARLDARRAAWQARVDAASDAMEGIDPDDIQARDAIIDGMFDVRERRRVRTLLGLR